MNASTRPDFQDYFEDDFLGLDQLLFTNSLVYLNKCKMNLQQVSFIFPIYLLKSNSFNRTKARSTRPNRRQKLERIQSYDEKAADEWGPHQLKPTNSEAASKNKLVW